MFYNVLVFYFLYVTRSATKINILQIDLFENEAKLLQSIKILLTHVIMTSFWHYYCYYYYYGMKISRIKIKVKTKSWSGHSSSLDKLLCNRMELKRWTVTDIRWKRKLASRISPETEVIFRPSSDKNAMAHSFRGSRVSVAIGWNMWPDWTKLSYLANFQQAACSYCTTWASRRAHIAVRQGISHSDVPSQRLLLLIICKKKLQF